MATKVCTKCGIEKGRAEFAVRKMVKDKMSPWCKVCNRAYYKENRLKILEQKKVYYSDNLDKIKIVSRTGHLKNRDDRLEKMKIYYRANKEAILERGKVYNKENRPIRAAYMRRWKRKQRSENPAFSIKNNVTRRMNAVLSNAGLRKSARSHDFIGCSWEDLAKHLERQFASGMSWQNRGEWHVDHIIPLASADTPEKLIPLFHFTNLRPLWAEENMDKGGHRLLLI